MSWVAVVLLVLGVWGLWHFARLAKDFKAAGASSVSLPPVAPPCPYCLEENPDFTALDRKGYSQYRRSLDGLDDAIDKNSRAVLKRIEKLLLVAPNMDHEYLAAQVVSCIEYLCEDMAPRDALKLYDKLHASGTALAFAEKHGQLDRLVEAFGAPFGGDVQSWTLQRLKDLMAFLEQDHPLLNRLRTVSMPSLCDLFDVAATEALDIDFDDWVPLQGSYPEIKAEVLRRIVGRRAS